MHLQCKWQCREKVRAPFVKLKWVTKVIERYQPGNRSKSRFWGSGELQIGAISLKLEKKKKLGTVSGPKLLWEHNNESSSSSRSAAGLTCLSEGQGSWLSGKDAGQKCHDGKVRRWNPWNPRMATRILISTRIFRRRTWPSVHGLKLFRGQTMTRNAPAGPPLNGLLKPK